MIIMHTKDEKVDQKYIPNLCDPIIHVFEKKRDIREYIVSLKKNSVKIGFVPTMGALHEGHASLIKRARQENELVICSIFVNPIQFNNPADLEKYPRNLQEDLQKLALWGCDVVFAPSENEMYPPGEEIKENFDFGNLDKVMEGAQRPGHFKGVAVVVYRLFDLIQADRAYFGEKDYQQILIIKSMLAQTNLNIEIVSCPIVREISGLAMSSRNLRLSEEQRMLAPEIYKLLKASKEKFLQSNVSLKDLKIWVKEQIATYPSMKLEYFELADVDSLQPAEERKADQKLIACVVVHMGSVRLIDNILYF